MRSPLVQILGLLLCLAGAARAEPLTVTGKVLDPAGKPLAGATVYLAIPGSSRNVPVLKETTTDGGGAFSLTAADPPGGPWRAQVIARKSGWGTWAATLESAPGKPERVETRLGPPSRVEGQVVGQSGQPIEGATVYVLRAGRTRDGKWEGWWLSSLEPVLSATTDAAGRFRLDGLP